jgi:DNA polymerase-3 subunit delta'
MSALIGHENTQALLKRTVEGGRPSHAYLFVGREGVGKKLVAVRFASMLNCPSADGDPECDCRVCRRVLEGKHPDVISEQPERGMIRIDRVRNIQKFFRYPPIEGAFRVVVIDNAHTMNRQAQNALLKTLEEPPPGRVLILVTAKPALLLTTVRSRCRKITFGPLPPEPLISLVQQRTGLSLDKARTLTALAGGSVGKALELADSRYLEIRDKALSVLIEPGKNGISGLLDFSGKISSNRQSALEAIEIAGTLIRDMLIIQYGADTSAAIHGDSLDIIAAAAQHHSQDDLFAVYDELASAAELIEADINVNKNLTMDVMLLKITRILAGPTYGIVSVKRAGDKRNG